MAKKFVDSKGQTRYRFTFGPWNIHEGADPFGPEVRKSFSFANKLKFYKELGFEGVQFHDDDAVPDMNDLKPEQIVKRATAVRRSLEKHGLKAEFVAPRLWEDSRTIDGGYTSNSAKCRKFALDRSKRCVDIANATSGTACGGAIAEPICNPDACNAGTDVCDNVANDSNCNNGSFCDGDEICDAVSDCQAGSDPCPGQSCDETGDVCTPAACDNDNVCEAGEDCGNCPNDCISGTSSGAVCGNGLCEAGDGENASSCSADCNGILNGKPSNRFSCGFGDSYTTDGCGDSRCTSEGYSCTEKPVGGGTLPRSVSKIPCRLIMGT